MQDTFTRNELSWLFGTVSHRATDPAPTTIARSLGLVPSDGFDAAQALGTLAARGLAADGRFTGGALILCQAAQTTTAIRGLATFEEREAAETSHRTTVLSGPLGHVSLWETPDGRFKLSVAGPGSPDPGINLSAKLANLAEEAVVEGTCYRLSTRPATGPRLMADTSFQFAEIDGPDWGWRPDTGDDEQPFEGTDLQAILAAVASPDLYSSPAGMRELAPA